MKAIVKETGKIVEVEFVERKTHTGEQVYMTHEGCLIEESRLDFNVEPIDYWTRLEHQYAGMAMQGLCANPIFMKDHEGDFQVNEDMVAVYAYDIAHALVKKVRYEENPKELEGLKKELEALEIEKTILENKIKLLTEERK